MSETATTFTCPLVVRSYELDSFGHVNHAVLLHYLEHARFLALEEGGFGHADLERRGWGVFVVRAEVDYLGEVLLGDELLVRTSADEPRRSSMVLTQEIVREDESEEVLLRARITAVWVGENRRPMRVPEEVRAAFGLDRGTDASS